MESKNQKKEINQKLELRQEVDYHNATADLKSAEFLTPTETARLLRISRSTLYRYLSSEEIKCRQFKGKTLQFSTPNLRSAVLALANNIINDPNYSSGGGGGDSSDLQWDGRKPGEDEDTFARRCLLYASQQVARNRKKGLHR